MSIGLLEKSKIKTINGKRYYVDGKNAGKEVGTIRGKGSNDAKFKFDKMSLISQMADAKNIKSKPILSSYFPKNNMFKDSEKRRKLSRAIRHWTGDGTNSSVTSHDIVRIDWGFKNSIQKENLEKAKEIHSAIYDNWDMLPSYNGPMVRKIYTTQKTKDKRFPNVISFDELKKGKTFTTKALSSFTKPDGKYEKVGGSKANVYFHVENNTFGKDISRMSEFPEEKEVIVKKGQQYLIDDVVKDKNGITHVYLVEKKDDNMVEKSFGEGSRGGKVVGHTKSGKPIYSNSFSSPHPVVDSYSTKDHLDAVRTHLKMSKDRSLPQDQRDEHEHLVNFHNGALQAEAQLSESQISDHHEKMKPLIDGASNIKTGTKKIPIKSPPSTKDLKPIKPSKEFMGKIKDFIGSKLNKSEIDFLIKSFDKDQLDDGIEVEKEHGDEKIAKKIAKDHLDEDPDYYKDWENKEKILFKPKVEKAFKSDIFLSDLAKRLVEKMKEVK